MAAAAAAAAVVVTCLSNVRSSGMRAVGMELQQLERPLKTVVIISPETHHMRASFPNQLTMVMHTDRQTSFKFVAICYHRSCCCCRCIEREICTLQLSYERSS